MAARAAATFNASFGNCNNLTVCRFAFALKCTFGALCQQLEDSFFFYFTFFLGKDYNLIKN